MNAGATRSLRAQGGGLLLAAFGHRRPTVDADALVRNLAGDLDPVIARVAEVASLPLSSKLIS